MCRNQRLHDAIRQSGKRLNDLAYEVGANPKTVGRWITTGRLPRPAIRQKLSEILGVPEAVLWPDAPGVAYGTSELVGIYTTRRELPPATVGSLLDAAERHVDVLAYAALWLWDTVPEFAERVELKIARGASVRICLGDPSSEAVLLRGQEEGIDGEMAGRCRLAIKYAQGVHYVDSDAVRLKRGHPLRLDLPLRRGRAGQQPPVGQRGARLPRVSLPPGKRSRNRRQRHPLLRASMGPRSALI
jgi:hypothetical protein